MVSNFRNPFFDTIGQFAKGHFVLIQSEQQINQSRPMVNTWIK